MVTLAPDFEWITTPSWMFECAPITIGAIRPPASVSSARITAYGPMNTFSSTITAHRMAVGSTKALGWICGRSPRGFFLIIRIPALKWGGRA